MYNKLFTKILDSSIWMEDNPTRIVWLTMLAAMDEEGMCQFASIANVAHRARVTLDEAKSALVCLEGPDENSSDPENGGQRIERVPGGWMVLNSQKYREMVTREAAREKTRVRVARHRDKKRSETAGSAPVTVCNAKVAPRKRSVTPSEADTNSNTIPSGEGVPPSADLGPHQAFIAGWMTYYSQRNAGAKYHFQAGKDGKAVKTLISFFESSDAAKRFIAACHKRTGEGYPFSTLTGTLSDLANNISRLQSALAMPPKMPNERKPYEKPIPERIPDDAEF